MIYDAWIELLDFILPSTGTNKELVYIGMVLTLILVVLLFKGGKRK